MSVFGSLRAKLHVAMLATLSATRKTFGRTSRPAGDRTLIRGLRTALGVINDNPLKGPVRFKRVYVSYPDSIPQGYRERRRRIRQVVNGVLDFSQLGRRREDALGEFALAKKNYALVGLGRVA